MKKPGSWRPPRNWKWRIALSGYGIARGRAVPGLDGNNGGEFDCLAQKFDIKRQGFREYAPFAEEPALFWKFARLAQDPQSIVVFANAYGRLFDIGQFDENIYLEARFSRTLVEVECPGLEGEYAPQYLTGEALSFWIDEIRDMSRLVEEWQSLRRRRLETSAEQRASRQYGQSRLLAALNEKMQRHTVRGVLRSVGEKKELTFSPESLIAALWLQFAHAVAHQTEFATCEQCHNPFPLTSKRETKFCSDACRFKAYRGRQKKAQELFLNNRPLREIADQLNSDIATVRKWVRK